VESKLRQLVMKLEYVDSLVIAHPFIKGFDQQVYCLTDEEVRVVAEGEFSPDLLKRKKEDCDEKEGRVIYTTTFYIGLAVEPRQRRPQPYCFPRQLTDARLPLAGQQGTRKLDISYPTNEFVKMVKAWDKYDGATMGVVVLNIRRCVYLSGC
jgi:poly(A) polymerase